MAQFEHGVETSDSALYNVHKLADHQRYGSYICPDCSTPFVLSWKNDIKERHFRHASSALASNCQGETDIHFRLKYAFRDAFMNALSLGLPFYAEVEQKQTCRNGCCSGSSAWTQYNLMCYDDVKVEQRHSHKEKDFIPDCILLDKWEQYKPLFFEVCVTSKVSDNKIAAGYPIVEMLVSKQFTHYLNDCESQCLEAINNLVLPRDLIKWHNFDLPALTTATCLHELERLRLERSRLQTPQRRLNINPSFPERSSSLEANQTQEGTSILPENFLTGPIATCLAELNADGRDLKFMKYFPFNGSSIFRDKNSIQYVVIYNLRIWKLFYNYVAAFNFCEHLKGNLALNANSAPQEDEQILPWWAE